MLACHSMGECCGWAPCLASSPQHCCPLPKLHALCPQHCPHPLLAGTWSKNKPKWYSLTKATTPSPLGFCKTGEPTIMKGMWQSFLKALRPLLYYATTYPPPQNVDVGEDDPLPPIEEHFRDARGLERVDKMCAWGEHPLHTECVVVKQAKRFFRSDDGHSWKFSSQTHKSGTKSVNSKYLRLTEDGLLAETGLSHTSILLHRLLCHMYHGPPPTPTHAVGHLCEHKLCILPWHMYWMPQGDNLRRHRAHSRWRCTTDQ